MGDASDFILLKIKIYQLILDIIRMVKFGMVKTLWDIKITTVCVIDVNIMHHIFYDDKYICE